MKRTFPYVLLQCSIAVLAIASASADEWNAIVLKAKKIEAPKSGQLHVELMSGERIVVPEKDWSRDYSLAVDKAIENDRSEQRVRSNDAPPSDADASGVIRQKCSGDWPDDFRMRKFCEDQQYKALRTLRNRSMTGTLATVRSKCAGDWRTDFHMREFCEKQQIEALSELVR